jgi:protein subunit release factor B
VTGCRLPPPQQQQVPLLRHTHTVICAGATDITPDSIPRKDIATNFSRSSGAGGQNVNKLNTKAEIRFHVATAAWMDDHTKQRLMLMNGGSVTKDGELVITSQRHRTYVIQYSSTPRGGANEAPPMTRAHRQQQRSTPLFVAHTLIAGACSQEANLEDCFLKLTQAVRKAAKVPVVRKQRTGLSELTKLERREDKRHRSGVKDRRRSQPDWE